MKRKVLLVLMVSSTLGLFAQFKQVDVILSADASYTKSDIGNGLSTSENFTNGKYLSLGASIGTFISKNIMMGIGVDYYCSNASKVSMLYLNDEIQREATTVNSRVLMPNLFLSFYQEIVGKLYYNTTIRFSYGKPKIESNSEYYGISNLPIIRPGYVETPYIGYGPSAYIRKTTRVTESDYFSTEISPEFSYFFTSRFGLSLQLGGVKYAMTDRNLKNSNWLISFNPNFWQLGAKIKL